MNINLFFRKLRKDFVYISVNTLGLSISIAIVFLLGFYLFFLNSYDKYIENYQNIYRVDYIISTNGLKEHVSYCSDLLAIRLKEKFPEEIEEIVTYWYNDLNVGFQCEDKDVTVGASVFCSPNFVDYYNLKFIYGNPQDAKNNDKSLIICERRSREIFGDENPVGKKLVFAKNGFVRYIITGVVKDFPSNSHVQTDFVVVYDDINTATDIDESLENYLYGMNNILLVLKPGTNPNIFKQHFENVKRNEIKELLVENNTDIDIEIYPITDIHFLENIKYDFPTLPIKTIYYYAILVIFIVVISIVNFTILNQARFLKDKKNAFIRKFLGAQNRHIFFQYFIELSINLAISLICSGIIVFYLFPHFLDFFSIQSQQFHNLSGLILSCILGILVLSIFMVLIPAILGSLRHKNSQKKSFRIERFFLEKAFITVQLIISTFLIISSCFVISQLRFSNNFDKGYDLTNTIIYNYYNYGDDVIQPSEITEHLEKSASIDKVSYCFKLPAQSPEIVKASINNQSKNVDVNWVAPDFIDFSKIQIIAGNNFLKETPTQVIVNESFLQLFNLDKSCIMQPIKLKTDYLDFEGQIVGVVKDFYYNSLKQKISPLILSTYRMAPYHYLIKYNNRNNAIEYADKSFLEWSKQNIMAPVVYETDFYLNKKYEMENKLSKILFFMGILNISMSLVGLFAVSAYTIRLRMKSYCIRKVFGADNLSLWNSILREFYSIYIVAGFISCMISTYFLRKWLTNFAYHVSLDWYYFALGLTGAALILITALSYHVLSVLKTKPTVYLRDE